jgi:hypothetical protein
MYQTAAALPEAQVGNGAAACHRQILDRHPNTAHASTSELEEHNTPTVKVTRAEQPPPATETVACRIPLRAISGNVRRSLPLNSRISNATNAASARCLSRP